MKLAKKRRAPQLLLVLAAAGSFAAISVIFGSPIVAAVLVIEASGLGGATLPLVLFPGSSPPASVRWCSSASSNGSHGLRKSVHAIPPLDLPTYHPTLAAFGWTILLAAVGRR